MRGESRHVYSVELGPVLSSRKKLSTPPNVHAWPLVSILFFLLMAAGSASFIIGGVDLTPNNATTRDTLVCTWNITGTYSQVNLTWYNGSNAYRTENNIGRDFDIITSGIAKKYQVWNCSIVVSNGTTIDSYSKKVTLENADPYKPNIASSITIKEDSAWSATLSSGDPDGDPVNFFCDPANIIGTCVNKNPSWTPVAADIGQHNVTVYAEDNDGGVSLRNVIFTVTERNDPPYFSPSLDSAINLTEGDKLSYSITMADEENNTGPFNFTVNSSYSPVEQITFSTADNKTFVLQFVNDRQSQFSDTTSDHYISVSGCDPDNSSLCVTGLIILDVSTINHPPNISSENITGLSQGDLLELNINATDIDNDTMVFGIAAVNCTFNPWAIETLTNISPATAIVNTTLTNDHVICPIINVTASDSKVVSSYVLDLNITNTNDAPIIHNNSFNAQNTHSNRLISNLTAYTASTFIYWINGTDIDSLTYEGEDLTYTLTCSSTCPTLSVSEEKVSFMPNTSFIGTYTWEVNLSDGYLSDVKNMTITVNNNTAPTFSPPLINLSGNENILYSRQINATDEQNDSLVFSFSTAMTSFDMTAAGLINFTPACADIGNHSVTLTVEDSVGASTQGSFIFEIVDTPDSPVLQPFSNVTIFENKPYAGIDVNSTTTDLDRSCSIVGDSLNFTSVFIAGSELFNITSGGIIPDFTPDSDAQGLHTVNITVTDLAGNKDSELWHILVLNRTSPPVIHNVTPYGLSGSINYGWLDVVGIGTTNFSIYENTTLLFNHTSVDPDGDELEYNWTIDGVLQPGTSRSFSKSWGFSSSGNRTVTLTVSDVFTFNNKTVHDNSVSFDWNVEVLNINRPPQRNDSLPNRTVDGRTTYPGYLSGRGWQYTGFSDPDGDQLTYTYSNVSKFNVVIKGDNVTFVPLELGNQTIVFNASDGEYTLLSNTIMINVINLSVVSEETVNTVQTGGGSSSSSSSSSSPSYIPYSVVEEVEVEKEVYLDILAPEPAAIYKNNTVRQVIDIINTGNNTLRGIWISAQMNKSEATLSFSTNFFPELAPGEKERTDLIITSYQLLNTYEIVIWANVTDPEYKDKAIIYVNAIEKSRGNQSVTATKITFARDLLSSNPECLELNEFLLQARNLMEKGEYDKAAQIIDGVVQGCKYLVSQSKLNDESPRGFFLNINFKNPFVIPSIIVFVVVMAVSVFFTIKAKKANES